MSKAPTEVGALRTPGKGGILMSATKQTSAAYTKTQPGSTRNSGNRDPEGRESPGGSPQTGVPEQGCRASVKADPGDALAYRALHLPILMPSGMDRPTADDNVNGSACPPHLDALLAFGWGGPTCPANFFRSWLGMG